METDNEIVIEGDRTGAVRQDRLWFLESMDQISRAMQDTEGLGQLSHVLETVLPIFGCDRVWLAYPCDPESRTWRMAAQHACPESADCTSPDLDLSMDAEIAEAIRLVSVSEVAVRFGAAASNSLPGIFAKRFGVESQMCIAVHPKIGKPYTFGLDQCAGPRTWTRQEEELFEAAGKRLATLLTNLLLSRDLQENKARLEEAQRVAHVGHWDWNLETGEVIWSDETYRIFGFKPQERPMDIVTVSGLVHPDDREALYREVDVEVAAGVHPVHEHRIVRPSGEVRTVHSITSKLWSALPGDVENAPSGKPHRLFGTVQDITELKHAEEARHGLSRDLQESKEWLEEAQRVAHIGYWVWDLTADQLICSDEYYRIHGLPPRKSPIELATVTERIHPEDRETVLGIADEAIRSGVHVDCEHRLLLPNGEVRVVNSLADLKKDSSGRPYQMFGTTQDITQRKRAEQALRRSQFYLSEGQRIAHIGSWAFNESGHYWSDELFNIYGLESENGAPTVEQYLDLIHPQDRAAMAETIRKMQEEHCGHDLIERIIRPDGQLRYVRAVAVPVIEEGVFKGFIGSTMDVTEQELLTRELRREQAYLAEAQSLAHIGSWAANFATMENFHLSDETYRIHGVDPSIGLTQVERFWATVHPEDEPAVRAIVENAIRTGADYDIPEFRICRADDGQIRFLRTIGHRNPAGEIGEYFGITMDITELKRAEEERERLRQLEADLAHINRVNMMGELAAALAHEIKQPIAASVTSASACLRWLAHDPPDLERARAAAARIEQEGNRAADIINSLRSFYKTGAPAERQSVDVQGAIGEMAALLRTEAARHAVTIRAESEADMPHILADRVQLQQVLMNLMLNAIEAMKDTGGELTIRSEANSEGLAVSISDTGAGLPIEGVDLIFDPFHTTKPQGTGMGLTITRSIVESYGGQVWATANQGPGATFHFTLPTGAEARA